MVGHISYLSEKGMQEKFGRKLQEKADYEFSFDADFQVESYLRHQGYTFVERFDANSILYITRAMDYFDLSRQFKGGLVEAFQNQQTKFLVNSFSSDWLYTARENKDTVIALNAAGADVSFAEIKTDKGHDSFLVNEPEFLKILVHPVRRSHVLCLLLFPSKKHQCLRHLMQLLCPYFLLLYKASQKKMI